MIFFYLRDSHVCHSFVYSNFSFSYLIEINKAFGVVNHSRSGHSHVDRVHHSHAGYRAACVITYRGYGAIRWDSYLYWHCLLYTSRDLINQILVIITLLGSPHILGEAKMTAS